MSQPEVYKTEGDKELVCRLKRSLYGLKQAPRCWNTEFDTCLKRMGFIQSPSDPCLYVSTQDELSIVAVYGRHFVRLSKQRKAKGN